MAELPAGLRHVADGRSIPWLLDAQATRCRDKTLLVWEPFDRPSETWSYARFAVAVRRLAAGLRHRGVKRADRIVIHMENCPEFLLAWFACTWIGAVPVLTNTRSTVDELTYFIEHSGATAALTQPAFAATVDNSGHGLVWIAVTASTSDDATGGGADQSSSFAALIRNDEISSTPVSSLDPATIQYTSGTTARPKGVVWTHANVLWGAQVSATHEGLTGDDVHLIHLPLFHTNALIYSVLASMWSGASFVLQPRFSASRFWDVSARNGCTWASMVGYCYKALSAYEVPKKHSYRLWGSGACRDADASGLPPTLGWWGMTETISHPIVGHPVHQNRPGSMGRPAPEYEVCINRDDGTPVEIGETGNLSVRGVPGVSLFLEYLDDPEATIEAYDGKGWLQTGDLVTPRHDGSIDFSDRAKDVLKVGGENVAASEIERIIGSVAGVEEVAVVGAPDPMLDQVPVAFIIADPKQSADPTEAVLRECQRVLAAFKVPRHILIVRDLPRSTLNKVAKADLRMVAKNLPSSSPVGVEPAGNPSSQSPHPVGEPR
jgi:crotonobetaine/carnitine-CoA ligase